MYNRYIPQPDGTYLRSKVPDPTNIVKSVRMPNNIVPELSLADNELPKKAQGKHPSKTLCANKSENMTSFLRQLLPGNIDSGDLMIILLLLLIAGDCEDDRNNALLTLALYFFM